MSHTTHITVTSRTPWGPAQDVELVAPGISFVSTASHGGFLLASWRQAIMWQDTPDLMAPSDFYPSRSGRAWFEEDVEASRVVLAFPQDFNYAAINAAHDGLKYFHPEMIARWKH